MIDLKEYIIDRASEIIPRDKEEIKNNSIFIVNLIYEDVKETFDIEKNNNYTITDEIKEYIDKWIKKSMVYCMD